MKNLLIFIVSLAMSVSVYAQVEIKRFVTDGCTLFVDGTPSRPALWRTCCVEHDMRYWFGGDHNDLDKADLRLRECVKDVAGSAWANLIYSGVRTGHLSPLKNKTRWSWGWITKRANSPLNEFETQYIIEELRRLPYDAEFLEKFIERNFNKPYDKI